jgi:hypothetical protein
MTVPFGQVLVAVQRRLEAGTQSWRPQIPNAHTTMMVPSTAKPEIVQPVA